MSILNNKIFVPLVIITIAISLGIFAGMNQEFLQQEVVAENGSEVINLNYVLIDLINPQPERRTELITTTILIENTLKELQFSSGLILNYSNGVKLNQNIINDTNNVINSGSIIELDIMNFTPLCQWIIVFDNNTISNDMELLQSYPFLINKNPDCLTINHKNLIAWRSLDVQNEVETIE